MVFTVDKTIAFEATGRSLRSTSALARELQHHDVAPDLIRDGRTLGRQIALQLRGGGGNLVIDYHRRSYADDS
jgi:hypothetical protein